MEEIRSDLNLISEENQNGIDRKILLSQVGEGEMQTVGSATEILGRPTRLLCRVHTWGCKRGHIYITQDVIGRRLSQNNGKNSLQGLKSLTDRKSGKRTDVFPTMGKET